MPHPHAPFPFPVPAFDPRLLCVLRLPHRLRKFATLNHHYMACGSWDTLGGYLDHMTSKHFRKLRE